VVREIREFPDKEVRPRTGAVYMDLEALNRDVLLAIGLFAVLLYVALLYAGVTEFRSRISKKRYRKKRFRNRSATRGLPKTNMPIWQRLTRRT
jgi:hypothetical protein